MFDIKSKVRKHKSKIGYLFFIFFLIGMIISSLLPVGLADETEEFSDELQHESYDTIEYLVDWYDGVETFWFDVVGNNPIAWKVEEYGGTALIVNEDGHEQCLELDDDTTNDIKAWYYFNEILQLENTNDWFQIEFWYKNTNNDYLSGLGIVFENENEYDGIWFQTNPSGLLFNCFIHDSEILMDYTADTWYHIDMYIEVFNSTDIHVIVKVDNVEKLNTYFVYTGYEMYIEHITVETVSFQYGYEVYFDALTFRSSEYIFNTQIQNIETVDNVNYIEIPNDKVISMYSSLIDKYPNAENNHRTWLLSDKIITDNYVDKYRVLRLTGTETSDNKYKVLQFYFDDLNLTESFSNQTEITNISGKHDYNMLNGTILNENWNDLNEIDGNTMDSFCGFNGILETDYVESNDNLSLHTLDAFPDSTTDGKETFYMDNYNSPYPQTWIHVVNSYTDTNGLSFTSRNLRTYDGSSSYPAESCQVHFDSLEYGNWSYDMVFNEVGGGGLGNDRFGSFLRSDSTEVKNYRMFTGTWQNGYSGIPLSASSMENNWFKFEISFECRNGISDNSGYTDLNSDTFRLRIYDYFSDTWYDCGIQSFTNDVDYVNRFDFSGASGSYYHDVRYHNFKLTKRELLRNLTLNVDSKEVLLDKDYYTLKTNFKFNGTQDFNVSIYNQTSSSWKLIQEYDDIENDWINLTYVLTDNINDYLDSDNFINVSFTGINETNDFNLTIDYFSIDYRKTLSYVGNQSIQARIDSFDTSGNLVNIYYINLDFNKSHGILTWNALYRESLDIPRWTETPTNPIFNFNDYMPEGTILSQLQVNIHAYLTFHSGQKWLYIRTDVVINDAYSMAYQYDKIIDGGNNAFYYSQEKILVRYIDYFNYNNASDYLGQSSFYTYNNLRGYRTLMLNSTDYKFNFLDAGYFFTDLDYYIPPEIPPDEYNPPDVPEEPKQPKLPYWTYDSYEVENHKNTSIYFNSDVDFYNDSVNVEWDIPFGNIAGKKVSHRYYYNPETFKKRDMPDLSFRLLGIKITVLNWLLDAGRTIVNGIIVLVQYGGFLLSWFFNFVIMYLIMVIIVPFLWNIVFFWIFYFFIWIGFFVYTGGIYILGWLWQFLIWLGVFMLEVVIPEMVKVMIILIAFFIALLIWLISGGNADLEEIFEQVHSLLTEMFDAVVESIVYFIDNIEFFFIYIIMYLLLFGLGFFKLWYRKLRGYTNSAEKLEISLKAIIFPFYLVYLLCVKIKQLVVPTS